METQSLGMQTQSLGMQPQSPWSVLRRVRAWLMVRVLPEGRHHDPDRPRADVCADCRAEFTDMQFAQLRQPVAERPGEPILPVSGGEVVDRDGDRALTGRLHRPL